MYASHRHHPTRRPMEGRRAAAVPGSIAAGLTAGLLATLLGGCAQPSTPDGSLPQSLARQLAEASCVGGCASMRERCNADARFDYRQCQAGYSEAFRDYRWCLASAFERSDCGYPWWPCAENLYGYCANRAADCVRACRADIAVETTANRASP